MFTLPVPFTGAHLTVGLPFAFLPTAGRVVASLALLVAFVVGVVWLYRAELRHVSPRVARVLLALRCAAFAAVFVVLAAGPVLVRTISEPRPGRVLVAVDLSDSMRVTDPDRPLGEKLRLARALRLHGGLAPDDALTGWIGDVEVGITPAGPAFDQLVARVNAIQRVEAAGRALTPYGAALLDKLKDIGAVELVGFGQSITDLPAEPDALHGALAVRSPASSFTDLKLPLARAAESRSDAALLGVVVLTDGRHNWGEPPPAAARVLGGKGVPVFPVNLAPKEPAADVAVISVRPTVTTVCRGSSVPVDVQVRVTRWPAGPVEVALKLPDGPSLVRTLPHDGTDQTYDLTFHPRFERPGSQPVLVEARPAKPDGTPANDSRTARVNVVEYRPRVLLIDGEARWEFKYLQSALVRSRDPELEVSAVVFRQPRIGRTPDTDAEKVGLPALKLPDQPDFLTGFDCVILGDVTTEQFPLKDRERLEKFVADAGGTLIVVAGKRFVPVELAAGLPELDPLRKLLPIRSPRAFTPANGFVPEFTPEGNRAWFLRLHDNPAENRSLWESLPAHHWGATGEAKDGADVLAWVNRVEKAGSGVPPERQAALVARHTYGFGRVLYVGLESTWRWRFKVGDDYHHHVWKQIVQWAAADRLLPAGNPAATIRFGTREPVYSGNREVEFLLRATEAVPRLTAGAPAAVRLVRLGDAETDPGELVSVVGLSPADGRPRELAARFRDLPPGRYAVEPDIPEWADHLRAPPGADGRPGRLRSGFEVTKPESEEASELSANLPLLEELAAATGGRVFDIAAVADLPAALASHPGVREVERSVPLDRSWWTLALVGLLLTTEWVVRKVAGLA